MYLANKFKKKKQHTFTHLLVEVDAQLLVQDRDLERVGAREDAERDVDHLQVLGPRRGGYLPRPRPDVVDDGVLGGISIGLKNCPKNRTIVKLKSINCFKSFTASIKNDQKWPRKSQKIAQITLMLLNCLPGTTGCGSAAPRRRSPSECRRFSRR